MWTRLNVWKSHTESGFGGGLPVPNAGPKAWPVGSHTRAFSSRDVCGCITDIGTLRVGVSTKFERLPVLVVQSTLLLPLATSDQYLMIPHDPFGQLRNLDKTSPQFPEQVSNFLHGDVYQSVFPGLESDNLVWFVEYLDGVSLHPSVLHCVALRTVVGSCWYFKSYNPDVQGILARAREDLWRQGSAPEIVYTSRVSSGPYTRGYL